MRKLWAIALVAISWVFSAPAVAAEDPGFSVPEAVLDSAVSCPPSFVHPSHEPVLLIHGTGATAQENWSWNYGSMLPSKGYDVCTVDLPQRALGDIQISSEYVVWAIRKMSAASGRSVDVLTHSQGGLEARWALKWWPSTQTSVDDLITLGAPHHGVSNGPIAGPAAVWQMLAGSNFLRALNSGDETPGNVSYTSIWSRTDEIVQFLGGDQPTSLLNGATSIALQDICPMRHVGHVSLLFDSMAFALVMDALGQPGPADPARVGTTPCLTFAVPEMSSPTSALMAIALLLGLLNAGFGGVVPAEPALAPYAQGS